MLSVFLGHFFQVRTLLPHPHFLINHRLAHPPIRFPRCLPCHLKLNEHIEAASGHLFQSPRPDVVHLQARVLVGKQLLGLLIRPRPRPRHYTALLLNRT